MQHDLWRAVDHEGEVRLPKAGTALFVLSLVCSLAGLCGYPADVAVFHAYGAFFTVAGAGLPTAGSALFGIRGQNDFSGAARAMAADLTDRQGVCLDGKFAIPS